MPKRGIVELRERERPPLDISSYGRRGPGVPAVDEGSDRAHLRRVPEVVVKVSGGAPSLRRVAQPPLTEKQAVARARSA